MSNKTPYVVRRGDAFALRVAVPVDLRAIVGCREIVRSLRTPDRSIATPLALELAAAAKRLFNEVRAGMSESDDEKMRLLVQRAKHKLQLDEQRGQHENEIAEQRRLHIRELKAARLEAENNALRSVLSGFSATARGEPLAATEITLDVREAPAAAVPAAKGGAPRKLPDVLPIWHRMKKPAPSTVDAYEGAVKHFMTIFPKLTVENIERRNIRDYIERRQAAGASAKSIEKEHAIIRALLTIAQDQEWVASNVAKGVILPKVAEGVVRGYRIDELQAIFDSPVFIKGERPAGGKGEAAYWIPLLMLYSGARRDEIAQLTTDHIRQSDGVPYIAIDAIEGGRLKTAESKRAVPVHDALQKIGFLDFVAARSNAGGGQLFPELKPNKRGQYGAKWGDWWGKYVREVAGIGDTSINPAHSFRHAFVTECRRVEMREDFERALVGHVRGSARRDTHDGYGEHLVTALKRAIDRIEYNGLHLSFVAV